MNKELETTEIVMFSINDETRKAITQICANKPYNTVFGIINALGQDELTADEANAIVNELGKFPYIEVHEFFKNVNKYFIPLKKQDENETKSKEDSK